MEQYYSQISLEERCEIYRLRAEGISQNGIARRLGRHPSTIGREIRRNSLPRSGYKPSSADRMSWARRLRGSKIERRSPLKSHILESLAMERSPEQIVGRLRREGSSHRMSVETIYAWAHSQAGRREGAHKLLPYGKSRRGRRARKTMRLPPIPNRMSIHERPEAANERSEPGHWEGDLMLFGGQREVLLTMTERKSRLLLARKLPDRKAETTANTMTSILLHVPEITRKTITFDNGGEFYAHQKLPLQAYFCDPHSPWQRGSVENANGVLRRSLPRKTRISKWSDNDIDDIIWTYNTTPRKCLGFLTPLEAFAKDQGVALEF
jgi:IS30 family transposase